jgi:hypothetical protein
LNYHTLIIIGVFIVIIPDLHTAYLEKVHLSIIFPFLSCLLTPFSNSTWWICYPHIYTLYFDPLYAFPSPTLIFPREIINALPAPPPP